MLPLRLLVACALAGVAVSLLPAEDKKPTPADDVFKPMFDGKTLDGWVNVNCHPDTFVVKGDEVVTTGTPTGFLRTDRQYENFVLEMDWMHVNTKEVGNSGLFVWGDPLPAVGSPYTRGIEVQVLVNLEYKDKKTGAVTATSHGDLFSIWGAKCVPDRPHPIGWERCLPSENRAKGGGEWNHYKVTANDGVIKLEVNGKEVSGVSKCNPRKGYLALESEGAECHFKNIKIKELPTTNPKPEEVATVAEGYVSWFSGLDFTGWEGEKHQWKVSGGVLKAAGKGDLVSSRKFGKYELQFDWKVPAQSTDGVRFQPSNGIWFEFKPGDGANTAYPSVGNQWEVVGPAIELKPALKANTWVRTLLVFDGTTITPSVNGQQLQAWKGLKPIPAGAFRFVPSAGLEIMNVFLR